MHSKILIQINLSVNMNYKHLIPSTNERSKNLPIVMANRRQMTRVLPKMLTVLLIELEDLNDAQEIVYAKSFLPAFEHFAQTLTPESNLSKSMVEVLGFVSDLYMSTQWNPNRRLPFETPAEILKWFCVFLVSHFSESELSWDSKIGKEVLEQFKRMQIS